MPKYDIRDEALIAATPRSVYDAVVDEIDGKTNWWMPFRSTRLLEGGSYGTVRALVESTIHGRWPVRFTTATVEVDPGVLIRVENVEGSFRGNGLWTFEEVADQTRFSDRWQTSPAGTQRFLAPLLPVAKSHRTPCRPRSGI